MKSILLPAALALALAAGLTPAPVQAAGCLKGAAIGGVAGHLAGHHTLLGRVQAAPLGIMRQTSTRANAPTRTEHRAAPVVAVTATQLPALASDCRLC